MSLIISIGMKPLELLRPLVRVACTVVVAVLRVSDEEMLEHAFRVRVGVVASSAAVAGDLRNHSHRARNP